MMFENFLSPIDDYSDFAFRILCQRYGAKATCVPLVNSTAISNKSEKVKEVDAQEDEKDLGVQIVGNVPEEMGLAAKRVVDYFPFVKWLNINCGCPSQRTMTTGGGSAMLAFPDKIVQSVMEIKRQTELPVSVKIRIRRNFEETLEICKVLEKAGTDWIIIHARTAQQGYSGNADWELIKKINERIKLPIVGNGDIRSLAQGQEYVKKEYCESFMIARAAMTNPKIFLGVTPETIEEKLGLLEEYMEIHQEYSPGALKVREIKLKAVNFISGVDHAAKYRSEICKSATVQEILNIFNSAEPGSE
ncbi:tRNA-dihydrouridine synthase family protein [Candidatus Micrarchaeota archaeon]|nr:tRNA-dihydrouridine synthase family protein [Candidatus Micrarchaeota archaeon]